MRGPRPVVEHRLTGGLQIVGAVGAEGVARVRVPVEAREGAAGHQDADAMPWLEQVARGDQVDLDFVDPARFYRSRLLEAVAETHAPDAFGQNDRAPVRVDVGKLDNEVGIRGV